MNKALFLLLFCGAAHAGPFAEVGVGHLVDSCVAWGKPDGPRKCTQNPVIVVAVGYQWKNGIKLQFEHLSQPAQKDTGLNMVSIRYRWE